MPIITDSKELKERIKALKNEEFVAVDTEFLRERTYYPLLCLVQIAGENDAFAVDTLAPGIKLEPMYDLLLDKKITKVFHACQQDFEIILNYMDKLPRNIFDTQIAAQMLGYGESVSYAKLAEMLCNVELDKSSRYTDWSKRPLSEGQVKYALSDVTYLRTIYTKMVKELEKLGRLKWVYEESEHLTDPKVYRVEPEDAWTKIKIRTSKPQFVAVVKELAKWREIRAQKINKPRQWILKNDSILEMAATTPETPEELKKIRFFSTENNDLINEILKVIAKGVKAKPPKIEKKHHLPRGLGPLIELLKVLLKMQCEKHDVAPSVVANSDDLEIIAMEKKPNVPAMSGWRYDIFGKYAMDLKEGRLALTTENNKLVLIEPAYE